jgi:hypothetical protein
MLVDSCFPFAAVAGCRLAAVDCCFAAVGCSFVSQETNLCAEPLSVGPRGQIMDGMRDLKDGKRPRVVVVGHRTEKNARIREDVWYLEKDVLYLQCGTRGVSDPHVYRHERDSIYLIIRTVLSRTQIT